jgi:hypothetical protein
MNSKITLCLAAFIGFTSVVKTQVLYPGVQPGSSTIKENSNNQIVIDNTILSLEIALKNEKAAITRFTDKISKLNLTLADAPVFELILDNGILLSSDDFSLIHHEIKPTAEEDNPRPYLRNSLHGNKFSADLENRENNIKIHWEIILRDDANYVRQIFTLSSGSTINLSKIRLVKIPASAEAEAVGKVDGSPVVYKTMFFAVEHPMSQIAATKEGTSIYLARSSPLQNTSSFTISSVWGIVPANQLRRGFLYYTEHERAQPYHQMLHYNSWYDLSWEDRILNDSLCLDRIYAFRDSLIVKRGIHMNAFLFDDGWDDYKTIWQFHSKFPQGFTNLARATSSVGAGIGVWMSPWGGYDIRKPQRLEYGAKQNPPFETNENGFTLTGPVYFKYFTGVATDFIKKYGVSIFKLDGVGEGNDASGANLAYQNDIEAFLRFTDELRKVRPDIYLSLTIGTWPSVYFLRYGDATWRSGDDTNVRGKGTRRQQWINYRDSVVYVNVVKRAPLYPLNSIMYHGITIGNVGIPGTLEMNEKDIADEIWSFFGSGTSLQEMYINPHKLNSANWDCLAKAIRWAKENESVMPDVHWIGGDPSKDEVYGYAAWTPEKAYVSIRNPSEETRKFEINTSSVFELPERFTNQFSFYDARSADTGKLVSRGQTITLELKPYEVKVLNAVPVK